MGLIKSTKAPPRILQSKNALTAVLPTEGRVVGLCWENSNLKDLKDL